MIKINPNNDSASTEFTELLPVPGLLFLGLLAGGMALKDTFTDFPSVDHQPSSPSASRTWDVRALSDSAQRPGGGLPFQPSHLEYHIALLAHRGSVLEEFFQLPGFILPPSVLQVPCTHLSS